MIGETHVAECLHLTWASALIRPVSGLAVLYPPLLLRNEVVRVLASLGATGDAGSGIVDRDLGSAVAARARPLGVRLSVVGFLPCRLAGWRTTSTHLVVIGAHAGRPFDLPLAKLTMANG